MDKTDIYNIPGRLCVDFDKTSFDTVETHFICCKVLQLQRFWGSLLHELKEEFEDTKGVIRNRKSKDKQYNGQ